MDKHVDTILASEINQTNSTINLHALFYVYVFSFVVSQKCSPWALHVNNWMYVHTTHVNMTSICVFKNVI
jgi:hypothetical protein